MTGRTRATVELQVPFHDVDALRVVWHGHYYKYMEIARTALLRSLGLEADPAASNGDPGRPAKAPGTGKNNTSLRVVDAHCRYLFPLTYGDHFTVTAWVKDVDPQIRIAYEIFNVSKNRRSARARTSLVVVTDDGMLVTQFPSDTLERLLA